MNIEIDGLVTTLGFGYYLLVYGIGIVAMTLSVISFQFKKRVTIILCNFLGQSSWIAYFLLQGDVTSAIACLLSAVMLAVFAKSDKWAWATHPLTIVAFIVMISGFSLLSFRGWTDIFPLLAGVFAVIANSRKNERSLRIFSFFWSFLWLMNSAFKFYPVALLNDSLCTISTVVALIRYRKTDKTRNEET